MPVLQLLPPPFALIRAATSTGAADYFRSNADLKTYQASGTTSSGTGAVQVAVQGSNDGNSWDTIGTITLSLSTTNASDSFTSSDRYAFVRANVLSISGTGANVTVLLSF